MGRPNPAAPKPYVRALPSDDVSQRINESGLIQPNSHPELSVDTPLDKLSKFISGFMKPKTAPSPVVKSQAPPAAPVMSKATEDSLSRKYLGR